MEGEAWGFLQHVTAETREMLLDWMMVPWTFGEMVAAEPDQAKSARVLAELADFGVIHLVDGVSLADAVHA